MLFIAHTQHTLQIMILYIISNDYSTSEEPVKLVGLSQTNDIRLETPANYIFLSNSLHANYGQSFMYFYACIQLSAYNYFTVWSILYTIMLTVVFKYQAHILM